MTALKQTSALAAMHGWLDNFEQNDARGKIASNDPQQPESQGATACAARIQRFIALGMSKKEADALAARLIKRDENQDDRRSCAECSRFERGYCTARREPFGGGGVAVLHRCAAFQEAAQ